MAKVGSLFFLGLSAICIAFALFGDPENLAYLTHEDGAVENLTAILYLLGLLFSATSIGRENRLLLPIVWAVLCLIFLGEETSWFQRIFDYNVPSIEKINAQKEFNLHNLFLLEGIINEGTGFHQSLNAQNFFRVGFISYFFILPLLSYSSHINRILARTGYQRPRDSFTLTALSIVTLTFLCAIGRDLQTRELLAETRELMYACIIFAYIYSSLWQPVSKRFTRLWGQLNQPCHNEDAKTVSSSAKKQ